MLASVGKRPGLNVFLSLHMTPLLIDHNLCIIQDSKQDWSAEAACMANVYKNSICNFAAASAMSSAEGCFVERNASALKPCSIRVVGHPSYSITDIRPEEEFLESPLNKRAWVLQERFLAPRVLHFGKRQLFWECRKGLASEMHPKGVPSVAWVTERDSTLVNARSSFQAAVENKTWLRNDWKSIVITYSRANLTVASDKLVALSGIATEVQRITSDDYLAGLWRSDLINQLAWYVENWSGVKPQAYRAPSWSWASVDGQILYENWVLFDSWSPLVSILHAQVTTVDGNKPGQVSHGLLRLRGTLFKPEALAKNRMEGSISPGKTMMTYIDLEISSCMQLPADGVFCLPLIRSRGTLHGLRGLLLRACDDGVDRGRFERVGYFIDWDPDLSFFRAQPQETIEIV